MPEPSPLSEDQVTTHPPSFSAVAVERACPASTSVLTKVSLPTVQPSAT